MNYPKFKKQLLFNTPKKRRIFYTPWVAVVLLLVLFQACQKEALDAPTEEEVSVLEKPGPMQEEGQLKANNIFAPSSGGNCRQAIPKAPFWGAGNGFKQSWHRVVKNQSQLISAINHVNNNGGTIFIDASFNVTQALPKITRNNVTILSKSAHKIYDKVAGGTRASELFRVEAANFTMKHVTILGIGHTNPNNPGSWAGKRSAVAVTKDNASFEAVFIQYYTHAAIRLENGRWHKVINSTLVNQKRSDLGYGVLLRNDARNVLIKRNRFHNNTHSVATTGGRNQSYRAEGNWTTNSGKWHFDVHMGRDNWGGHKIELINNVSNGSQALLVVRGPFTDGVYIRNNLYNKGAGDLVKLKPDRTFQQGGTTFFAGNFYGPFFSSTSARNAARVFFNKGQIKDNCVWQNYNNLLSQAPR